MISLDTPALTNQSIRKPSRVNPDECCLHSCHKLEDSGHFACGPSLSSPIQRGRVRLEDERVEDPPPFRTFVVLSDFETLQNFFLTDCGPIQGVTIHEYSLKYFHSPISPPDGAVTDSPLLFPVFVQAGLPDHLSLLT